jgi:hypothetical protein
MSVSQNNRRFGVADFCGTLGKTRSAQLAAIDDCSQVTSPVADEHIIGVHINFYVMSGDSVGPLIFDHQIVMGQGILAFPADEKRQFLDREGIAGQSFGSRFG